MPNGQTALVPVVMGMNSGQVILASRTSLPAPALKIAEITGEFKEMDCRVIPGKVIVEGVLHKQAFLVGVNNVVFHVSQDEPFSALVEVPGAAPDMACRLRPEVEEIRGNLVDGYTLDELSAIALHVILLKEQEAPFSPRFRMNSAG